MEYFATGETLDLGNVPSYWQVISQEFAQVEALPPLTSNRILSDRAFDEAQVAGKRPYLGASRYLGVARDNHEALLSLLQHHGATPWAPWSLLRPIFESSFFAAWLLDPDEGRERRWRGLRAEILDSIEGRRHLAAFKALPDYRKLIAQQEAQDEAGPFAVYRKEAAALGRSFDAAKTKINVVDEIRRLSFAKRQPLTAVFLEAVWRQLSGFEHGLGWALMRGLDREIVANVPGGAEVKFIMNDDTFQTATKSAYFLLITACRLLRDRHLASHPPARS